MHHSLSYRYVAIVACAIVGTISPRLLSCPLITRFPGETAVDSGTQEELCTIEHDMSGPTRKTEMSNQRFKWLPPCTIKTCPR